MLDIVIGCPKCKKPIAIKSSDFHEPPPIYEEMTLEARAICECKHLALTVVIFLEESEDENEGLYIDHIEVETESFEAS